MLSSLVGRNLGNPHKQEVKAKVELSPAWLSVEGVLKVHPNIDTELMAKTGKITK